MQIRGCNYQGFIDNLYQYNDEVDDRQWWVGRGVVVGFEDEEYSVSCEWEQVGPQLDLGAVKSLVREVCSLYRIEYSEQLGYVLAHINTHFQRNQGEEYQQRSQDFSCACRIVDRFQLVFKEKQLRSVEEGGGRLRTFEDVVQYASLCVFSTLPQKLAQSVMQRQGCTGRLRKVVRKLCGSLLLQFVPVQYSSMLLGLYLSEGKERIQQKCNEVYPYEELMQLMCSLGYHIAQTRNVVGFEHFLRVLENPLMGVVEWPMVIGARSYFELPI